MRRRRCPSRGAGACCGGRDRNRRPDAGAAGRASLPGRAQGATPARGGGAGGSGLATAHPNHLGPEPAAAAIGPAAPIPAPGRSHAGCRTPRRRPTNLQPRPPRPSPCSPCRRRRLRRLQAPPRTRCHRCPRADHPCAHRRRRTRRRLLPPARFPACRCRAHSTPIPRGRRAVAPRRRRPHEVPGQPLAPARPSQRGPLLAAEAPAQADGGGQPVGAAEGRLAAAGAATTAPAPPLAKPASPQPPPRPDGWRNGGAGAALPGSARAPQGVSTINPPLARAASPPVAAQPQLPLAAFEVPVFEPTAGGADFCRPACGPGALAGHAGANTTDLDAGGRGRRQATASQTRLALLRHRPGCAGAPAWRR